MAMGSARKLRPYLILAVALLLFVFPVLFNRTLTNFSDTYAMWPGSEHAPAGCYHSNAIDASPIFMGWRAPPQRRRHNVFGQPNGRE
jgi:hypothetical protein